MLYKGLWHDERIIFSKGGCLPLRVAALGGSANAARFAQQRSPCSMKPQLESLGYASLCPSRHDASWTVPALSLWNRYIWHLNTSGQWNSTLCQWCIFSIGGPDGSAVKLPLVIPSSKIFFDPQIYNALLSSRDLMDFSQ